MTPFEDAWAAHTKGIDMRQVGHMIIGMLAFAMLIIIGAAIIGGACALASWLFTFGRTIGILANTAFILLLLALLTALALK